jgi:lipoate-protein ligase A
MQPLVEIRPYDLADAGLMAAEAQWVLVWTVDRPCVVVGQSNQVLDSLDLEVLARDAIPVYRRPSGGQPVYLSPRTLQISALLREERLQNPRRHFERINGLLVGTISDVLGIDLLERGVSDLAMADERKVLGSSIYRSAGKVLYHGVLNLSESPRQIARYLRHPPQEPDYRRGRDHGSFVTSLAQQVPDLDVAALRRALQDRLTRDLTKISV